MKNNKYIYSLLSSIYRNYWNIDTLDKGLDAIYEIINYNDDDDALPFEKKEIQKDKDVLLNFGILINQMKKSVSIAIDTDDNSNLNLNISAILEKMRVIKEHFKEDANSKKILANIMKNLYS